MTNSNWQRAKDIFNQLLALPEAQRQAYFESHTKDNQQVKELVQELLDGENIGQNDDHVVSKVVGTQASSVLKGSQAAQKGKHISDYEIVDVLGEGGMGIVYLARRKDAQFEQTVAIKIIHAHALIPKAIERFRQERQILASLQHPNIGQLIGGGETDAGLPYIVMEYIDGSNIIEYCRENALSTEQRLDLFKQVLAAVNYAHQNLVIHRDIKPSNVLVTKDGVVKLLDFGIAKLIEEKALPEDANLTAFETKVLTPSNASPEQIKNEKITTKTDVYGLGTLLYQMLTELPLFDTTSATSREVENWILDKEPTKPSANLSSKHSSREPNLQSTLSGDLDTIILKSLQKDPERRYSSVEKFTQDIQCYLTNYPIYAKPESRAYKLKKFYQRNRAFSIVSTAFVICLLVFTSAVTYQAIVIEQARKDAVRESNNAHQVSQFLTATFEAANPFLSGDKQVTPKDLIDNASLRISNLDTEPLLKVQLLSVLATVYHSVGDNSQARKIFDEAIEIVEILPSIPETLQLTLDKIDLELELALGDIDIANYKAQQLIEKINAVYHRLDNVLDRQRIKILLVDTMITAGTIYDHLGDDKSALKITEEALAIAKADEDTHQHQFATIYSVLGHSYRRLLDYQKSIEMLLKAIEYSQARYGAFNLDVAYSYNQLASTYSQVDRYDEALSMALKGYEIRKTLFPDGNPEVSASLGMISRIYNAMGEEQLAIEYRRRSLAEIKRAVGEEDYYVGANTLGLSSLLINYGYYEEAEQHALFALPILKKHLPDTSIDLARPYRLLGKIKYYQGNYEEAQGYLATSMDICKKAKPDGHWITAEVHAYYALSYFEMNELNKAQHHKSAAIDMFVDIFGEDSKRAKTMRDKLAHIPI